jgi:hypothetical protein
MAKINKLGSLFINASNPANMHILDINASIDIYNTRPTSENLLALQRKVKGYEFAKLSVTTARELNAQIDRELAEGIKRAVVETMIQCVEKAPHGLIENAILDDQEVTQVAYIVKEFVLGLKPSEIDALKTGKGCTGRPLDTIDKQPKTLYEHMRTPTLRPGDAGCIHGWVFDSSKWAKQVATMNPNSNINWPSCEQRIRTALDQMKLSIKQYFTNPFARSPKNPDEALWFLAAAAGPLEDNPDRESLWKAEFQGLPRQFRLDPNLSRLDYARALQLYEKWYLNGDIPEVAK